GGRDATLVAAPCGQDIRPLEVDGAGRAFSPGTQEALRRRPSRAPMMRPVDDLVGPATGVANAAIHPDGRRIGDEPTRCPPTSVSRASRARERVGPVRRMVLAASAGGLVGAHIASLEPHMR